MKSLTKKLGLLMLPIMVSACSETRQVVGCTPSQVCSIDGISVQIHYIPGEQHAFELSWKRAVPSLSKAEIVGVNMDMGAFPLFIDQKDRQTRIKGIRPICTSGARMRWKVRIYSQSQITEVVLP